MRYLNNLIMAFVVCVVTLIFASSIYFGGKEFNNALQEKNQQIAVERMVNLTNDLTKNYEVVFKNSNTIANYLKDHPDATSLELANFIKKRLMVKDLAAFFNRKNNDFISAYVIAKDDVVDEYVRAASSSQSDVLPYSNIESKYYIELAKNTPDNVIVQGPIQDPKSHRSLIFNRKALFVDGEYWGYVGITVDFFKYLECVKLDIEDDNFIYAMRAPIPTDTNSFLWGDSSLFEQNVGPNVRVKQIYFSKQNWEIAVKVKNSQLVEGAMFVQRVIAFILYGIALISILVCLRSIFILRGVKSKDIITSTLNQQAFDERVVAHLNKSSRVESALVMIELQNFKTLNNIYGHRICDECLKEVARRIKLTLGYNDIVSRSSATFYVYLSTIKTTNDVDRYLVEIKRKLSPLVFAHNCALKITAKFSVVTTIEHGRELRSLYHALNLSIEEQYNLEHKEEIRYLLSLASADANDSKVASVEEAQRELTKIKIKNS